MYNTKIGRTFSGIYARKSIWSAIADAAYVAAFVFGVVSFFAILSCLGVVLGPKDSDGLVASSVMCLALTIGVAVFCCANARTVEKIGKASWVAFYKGTEWKTPAGETGIVSDADIDATHFAITFADGHTHTFPRRYLAPTKESELKARQSEKMFAGDGKWSFYSNRCQAVLVTLVFWVMIAVFGISLLSSDVPSWTKLPVFASMIFGGVVPFMLLMSSTPFSSSADTDYPALVSKMAWKALDGRIGVVRWAKREYEGDNVYSENIMLAFPEGDEGWFRRGDLKATVFEC
jgi:hypothetical protein